MVLFILAVLWLVYIGMWLRSRRERRAVNSISTFHKHLAVLGQACPPGSRLPVTPPDGMRAMAVTSPYAQAMTLADARNRRRQVLIGLAAAATATATLAFVVALPFLILHLLADIMLGAYLVLLVRGQRRAAERRRKVVYLPPANTVVVEPMALRQSAN